MNILTRKRLEELVLVAFKTRQDFARLVAAEMFDVEPRKVSEPERSIVAWKTFHFIHREGKRQ